MLLTLYVDDTLLAGNNLEMIKATKKWLSFVFEMKDMGEARYRHGNNQKPSKVARGYVREAYIKRILERFCMYNCKLVYTLIKKSVTLSLDQCPKQVMKRRQ